VVAICTNVILDIVYHFDFSVDAAVKKLGMLLPSGVRKKGSYSFGGLTTDLSNYMWPSFYNGHICLGIFLLYTYWQKTIQLLKHYV